MLMEFLYLKSNVAVKCLRKINLLKNWRDITLFSIIITFHIFSFARKLGCINILNKTNEQFIILIFDIKTCEFSSLAINSVYFLKISLIRFWAWLYEFKCLYCANVVKIFNLIIMKTCLLILIWHVIFQSFFWGVI